jgi:galactonate dehydratase
MSDHRLNLYRVAVSPRTTWWFIELRTPAGTGLGECSDAGTAAAVLDEVVRAADAVRGRDVLDEREVVVSGLAARVAQLHAARAHTAATVLGGLEQALSDLAARHKGIPLWEWLGGHAQGPIPLYANINRMPGSRAPEAVAACAADAAGQGFRAVKCAPFDVPDPSLPLADVGVARLRAVSAALPEGVELFADFHERLTWQEVESVLPGVADAGVAWVEDVVPVDAVDRLRELRDRVPAKVAGGEMMFDAEEAESAATAGVLDVLMPDVKHAGGVTRAAGIAAAYPELLISPHNPSGPVATLAGAHLLSTAARPGLLEYAHGEVPWRAEVLRGAERVEDGYLHLPDAPGLGADLDADHPFVQLVWSCPL